MAWRDLETLQSHLKQTPPERLPALQGGPGNHAATAVQSTPLDSRAESNSTRVPEPPSASADATSKAYERLKFSALGSAFLALLAGITAVRGRGAMAGSQSPPRGTPLHLTILEQSTECAVLMRPDGCIVHITEKGKQCIGPSAERPREGAAWPEWWLPEWRTRASEGVARAARGESVAMDLWMDAADTNITSWDVSITRLPQHENEEPLLLCVMQNTSARRRAQQELRESEERFSAFIDNSPAIAYIKEEDGRYLLLNKIYGEIRGEKSEALVGRSDSEVFGAKTSAVVERLETEVLRSGVPRRVVEDFTHSNGEISHWRVLRFPLQLSSGKVLLGAIGVDVTRTVVAEAELQVARDAALQSAKLKSEFLANMSHEIRTPMNGVIGMAGLLLDTPLSSRQREFAKTIDTSANALLTIINDVLDFSKIEAGMLDFEALDFELRNVIHGTATLLAESASNKHLELAVIVEPSVPQLLRGDPGRLRQILMNLLGNALKFTTNGEIIVECSLSENMAQSPKAVRLLFSVRDTGIGISSETQDRLFQAFSQADGSTTRRYGGTGLGLAISKQLIQRMRGEIGVQSELGKGSVFWFTAEFDLPEEAPHLQEKRLLHDHAIVLAGPHAATRRSLSTHLRALGATIQEACSAEELSRLLATWSPPPETPSFLLLESSVFRAFADTSLLRNLGAQGVRMSLLASLKRTALTPSEIDAGCECLFTKPLDPEALVRWMRTEALEQPAHNLLPNRAHLGTEAAPVPLKLLVAEDNNVNRTVVGHQLVKLGHEVVYWAENGREALSALEHSTPDAILMDCQMPEVDGYEATRAIRLQENAEGRPDKPRQWIIAMTANTMEGDREKCLASGMDDYVSKPLTEADLYAVLSRVPPRRVHSPSPEKEDPVAPVIDTQSLARLRDLGGEAGEELLASLAEQFIETSASLLAAMKKGLKEEDTEAMARATHTLRGSAANFGAHNLIAKCNALEDACGMASEGDLEAKVLDISQELESVRAALLEACLRA